MTLTAAHAFVADWNDQPVPSAHAPGELRRRALAIWPGLDHAKLRRTNGDPIRIARLAASRTSTPIETVLVLLLGTA